MTDFYLVIHLNINVCSLYINLFYYINFIFGIKNATILNIYFEMYVLINVVMYKVTYTGRTKHDPVWSSG